MNALSRGPLKFGFDPVPTPLEARLAAFAEHHGDVEPLLDPEVGTVDIYGSIPVDGAKRVALARSLTGDFYVYVLRGAKIEVRSLLSVK